MDFVERKQFNNSFDSKWSFANVFISKDMLISSDKKYFLENLSLMLSSGLDTLHILAALKEEVKTPEVKSVIGRIFEDVKKGSALWRAMYKYGILPAHLAGIIKMAESSGNLNSALKIVVEQVVREDKIRSELKVQVVLLAVVFFLTIFAPIILLSVLVIPSLITQIAALILLVGFFFAALTRYRKRYLYFAEESLLYKIPGFARTANRIELSRMGYLISTFLKSNLSISAAFHLLRESTHISKYKEIYNSVYMQLGNGKRLEEIIESSPIIKAFLSTEAIDLIVGGERVGRLESGFERLGLLYDSKATFPAVEMEETKPVDKKTTVIRKSKPLNFSRTAKLAAPYFMTILIVGLLTTLGYFFRDEAVLAYNEFFPKNIEPTVREVAAESVLLSEGSVVGKSNPRRVDETAEPEVLGEESAPDLVQPIYPKLQIKQTETGSLNVRATVNGQIIRQVYPGEVYEYIENQSGWYKILFNDGTQGWVIGTYTQLL